MKLLQRSAGEEMDGARLGPGRCRGDGVKWQI